MIATVLAALLLTPVQDAPCPPNPFLEDGLDIDSPKLFEPSGSGLWIAGTAFAAEDLQSAAAAESVYGGWELKIAFSPSATIRFAEISRCRLNRFFEISVDRVLVSRPIIMEPILGGKALISGNFTRESATALAARLVPPTP